MNRLLLVFTFLSFFILSATAQKEIPELKGQRVHDEAKVLSQQTVDYLERTLNYMFLRHPDPQVAAQLGQAAASCIGNPCEFDLNFRTDRVQALAGVKPTTTLNR